MRSLSDYDPVSLSARFVEWGFKPGHAVKLLREFYNGNGQVEPERLDLGKALELRIREEELHIRQSEPALRSQSEDGTVKLLVKFAQGGTVESVLMPAYDKERSAGCISSQIGCAMGCDFCASTRNGFTRDLSAGEMVEQFLHLRAEAVLAGRRLSTLVFMGMGEPMLNLDNVMAAIVRIASAGMGGLGGRQITVSTVGIVPGIDRLASAGLNVHLALSLHAPDDETRSKIVPPGKRYAVADVMAAARRFAAKTGRIVTIEYCMLRDVNDSDEQAAQLADLLDGFRAHVNLIPYNAIGMGLSGRVYERPSPERLDRFLGLLRDRGVVVHIRRTRGDDVNAACGQLAGASR